MVKPFVSSAVKSDPTIRIRLKEEFKRLGVSVEEAADASGIAKGTLDNIMSGRTESLKDVHIQSLWVAFPALRFEYVLTNRREVLPTVYIRKEGYLNVKFEEK